MNRREFSKMAMAGGAALLAPRLALASAESAAQSRSTPSKLDLLIQGGTVIDPSQNLHDALDVAIHRGKILEVARNIAPERALKVLPAKDHIVTPGLLDMHAHVYDGMSIGTNADHYCLGRGVTTVVDAGSTGYLAFPNFRNYIINRTVTRITALLHISAIGYLIFDGGLANLNWANPEVAAKMAMENRPAIAGFKVHLSRAITGANDVEGLRRAIEAGKIAGLPVMVHMDGPYSPLPDLLKLMRKGDVFTHCFNNHEHGILDANGKIIPEAKEARERGVIFDPAQGQTHLSFDVVEKCLQQDFPPDTISTDLTAMTVEKRVFDLPSMVGKFMAVGISLDKAIGMVTANPARVFDYGAEIGTLKPGSEGDVAIFELRDGKFDFEDSDGVKRTGRQMLVNKVAIRAGQIFVNEV